MKTNGPLKNYHRIEFQPSGRRDQCPAGESILEFSRRLVVGLASDCGGTGKCMACRVQVISGKVSEPAITEQEFFSSEEINAGWRLACQTYPEGECKVNVPAESLISAQRTQVGGIDVKIAVDPILLTIDVKMSAPSLSDIGADAENLINEINRTAHVTPDCIDIEVIRKLSEQLRNWDWKCRAHIRDRELISVNPHGSKSLGLAVDLGSTKIAGYLVDLGNGKTLAEKGIMNPQISYGEDIISRITYVNKSLDNRNKMQEVLLDGLNDLAADLCAEIGAMTDEILESVIVGNTAIHHLFLNLPVRQLAMSPFVPAVTGGLSIKARDAGLNFASGSYIYMLPNIAGFVGADHVAMLIAIKDEWLNKNVISLDIGTNTEISLITNGKIASLSCASGPVFEGYHIKNGVRAGKGAIEKITISAHGVDYETIENAEPTGICGSGILDAAAQLYLAGIIDRSGRIQVGSHPGVQENEGQLEFIIVSGERLDGKAPITVTQKDIREIQMGKAAIQAGIKVLAEANNMREEDIDKVIIAGAFGSYIDISNSIAIGMLPSMPVDRFQQVGNAAGTGAKMALLSKKQRLEAVNLQSIVHYIELAGYPDFMKVFSEACYLEHSSLKIRH